MIALAEKRIVAHRTVRRSTAPAAVVERARCAALGSRDVLVDPEHVEPVTPLGSPH